MLYLQGKFMKVTELAARGDYPPSHLEMKVFVVPTGTGVIGSESARGRGFDPRPPLPGKPANQPFRSVAGPAWGGTYMDGSALRRRYVAALRRTGLRVLRFHDLRHTFGTLAIRGAESIVELQA